MKTVGERKSVFRSICCTIILAAAIVLGVASSQAMALDVSGVWDSNWNAMTLWQNGTTVTGEYIYDKGVLIGELDGNIFTGWWREDNNEKACGPDNSWSGPVVLKFSEDGQSFTGDWSSCGKNPEELNPDGSGWTGTRRSGDSYTQSECENAGRYWCNGSCKISQCDSNITEEQCENSGRFWCDGDCRINGCESPVTKEDCETSGKYWCDNECKDEPCTSTGCTEEQMEEKYQAGRNACIQDPASCGIEVNGYTSADLEAKYNEGFEAGKASCENTIPVSGENCSTFNLFTNVLHIPCLDLGESYWVDLAFQGNHLNIVDFGKN